MKKLEDHHFQHITDTDSKDRYTHWDIEAEKDGKKYVFELKNRDFSSSVYGDVVINLDKYNYLKNSGFKAVLVTFFEDCWVMIDLEVPYDEEITRIAPRQTRFSDHRLIEKKMVSWTLKGKKVLSYD